MSEAMRWSRALPVSPPMTTATISRLPRFTEVTTLKPEALM
jgi:hypothetical protein